jgi:lysophospholipase L1-like esterase
MIGTLFIAAVFFTMAFSPVASAQSTGNSIIDNIWAGAVAAGGDDIPLNSTTTAAPNQTQESAPDTISTASTSGAYAALGDSVAAGLGLSSSVSQCGRSSSGYPHIVAQSRNLRLIDAACSGATAGDLFTKQSVSGPNITAQLTTAFQSGKPRLITITAGANDAHWLGFLRTCYVTNCATTSSTVLANGYLHFLSLKLNVALASISARSNGSPPRTVFTGYYNPISQACAAKQANVTPAELTWLTAEVSALNQTIVNTVAAYPNTIFVPINFTGHDICSSDPWVQGLNDPAPFHPTAAGQREIAKEILSHL